MLRILLVLTLGVLTQSVGLAQGNFFGWAGLGANDNFSTAANWVNAAVPTSGVDRGVSFGANPGGSSFNSTVTFDAATATSGAVPAYELSLLQFYNSNTPYTLNPGVGGPAIRFASGAVGENSNISTGTAFGGGTTRAVTINVPILTSTIGTHSWSLFGTGSFTVNSSVTILNSSFIINGIAPIMVNGNISTGSAAFEIYGVDVTLNGNNSGASGLKFNSTGTLTLGGVNQFGGPLLIANTGTVRFSTGDNRLGASGSVQFSAAGRLDLNGTNQQLAGVISSVAVNGGARISNLSATPSTFTYAPTTSATMTVTLGETNGNNLSFRYNPATNITTTLTATHTYTGTTTVANGTLALAGTGSIAASSRINLDASGTLDVRGLTGGDSYKSSTAAFWVRSSQTLMGQGTILGNVHIGESLARLQAGYGTATENLSIRGAVTLQFAGTFAPGMSMVVVAQDQPGNVRANQLVVSHPTNGNTGKLDLLQNGSSLIFELRDGGGLQQGVAYKMAIASAPVISRNGVTVSTVAGGENYTFALNEVIVFSSGFTITDVGLTAESGVLYLAFTPVPEPTTVLALAGLGLVGWLATAAL
jgi:autotransporter-associated beta strand protein